MKHPLPEQFPALTYVHRMRGLLFLLMAFDHALHAYAEKWAPFWFIRDYDRIAFFDGLYLFNQALIMPGIFLTFGVSLMWELQHKNCFQALKMMGWRYLMPTLIGFFLIVPLLTLPKYWLFTDDTLGFYDYLVTIWFAGHYQLGPFWVMVQLILLTSTAVAVYRLVPSLLKVHLRGIAQAIIMRPLYTSGFLALTVLIYTLSDFLWGAPWWIGFGRIVAVQGSKFIMNILFFFLGCGLYGLLKGADLRQRPLRRVALWATLLTLVLGVAYASYSVLYTAQAFYPVHRLISRDGLAVLLGGQVGTEILAPVTLRTALLGLLVCCQIVALYTCCATYLAHRAAALQDFMARHAWGLFIFHEMLVVWGQYALIDVAVHPAIKALGVFLVGTVLAYGLSCLAFKAPVLKKTLALKGD